MRQVVCAAKHCSDRGVFHRDIKLENLLITEDKTIKLIDFGCGDLLKEGPFNTFAGMVKKIMALENLCVSTWPFEISSRQQFISNDVSLALSLLQAQKDIAHPSGC